MTKWVRNCQKLGHVLLIMNIVNTGVGNGCHSNAVAPIARIYTSALLRGPSLLPPFSHGLPRRAVVCALRAALGLARGRRKRSVEATMK